MYNATTYRQITDLVSASGAALVVVSKERPNEDILALHSAGQRAFGESYVQELLEKKDMLPADIEWHIVGHLQRNKVRVISPFVQMIHSVDSYRLLKEIDTWAKEAGRVIDVLLQMHISDEATKFGFEYDDLPLMLATDNFKRLEHVRVRGLMGMASNTADVDIIRSQYRALNTYFHTVQSLYFTDNSYFTELSMGMSSDYQIALEEGATIVRIGSLLFE